ncbi:MAG TPA: hypothetical protein VKR32_18320 [Puia sp.]|nr:hypothetical protein [Puia sp.]
MKQFIKMLVVLVLAGQAGRSDAQTAVAGLFKDETDFRANRVSYPLSCDPGARAIQTEKLFANDKIIVRNGDKKTALLKKDFFGYRDCRGIAYRFYQNEAYRILDTTDFYLYTRTALEPNAGGKGFSSATKYYFSRSPNGSLELLTKGNLETAFKENARFRNSVGTYARNDNELREYDPYLKQYKVKYLFEESEK